jgi:hypothetical protein
MFDQSISERSLYRLLAKGDRAKYKLGASKEQYRAKLAIMAARISDPNFAFSKFQVAKHSHGSVFTPIHADDEFAIRKLNDNVKRHFSVKMADRNLIVPQVIALAREVSPFYLVKLDVKAFFENVDREQLLKKLLSDSSLSYTTRELLRKLFESPQLREQPGLPRGLSISSTLAEYCLMELDAYCRRLPYCYHFTRYVDDMLFFCHDKPDRIELDVGGKLPWGLQLNPKKTARIDVDKRGICKVSAGTVDRLSYLGYEFTFPTDLKQTLQISIPKKKLNKIKTRVILALVDYIKTRDYALLLSRFRFLASNFRISGSKQVGILYSGVYFNHRHIDKTSIAAFSDIDAFVRSAVFSKAGSLGRRLYPLLTKAQRAELCSNSLREGHELPKFRDFTNKELKRIMEAWNHA